MYLGNVKYYRHAAALFLALTLALPTCVRASVGLTVSPSTITNDYVGPLQFNITGLTPGQTVYLLRYSDGNTNGVAESNELTPGALKLTDGRAMYLGGVRNLNAPGDEDGATNGQIQVKMTIPALEPVLDRAVGNFLIRIMDTNFVEIAKQPFTILPKSYPQGIRGRATSTATGFPLTNAFIVIMLPPNGIGVGGVTADANGYFEINCPPGTYVLGAVQAGYVASMGSSIAMVSANQFVTNNLSAQPGTVTISGTLTDAANVSKTLGGVMIQAEGTGNLFAMTSTDPLGNYQLPVVPGNWKVKASESYLATLGYVAATNVYQQVSANVSGVNFQAQRANALIYGRLTDSLGHPLTGVSVNADGSNFTAGGRSMGTNGNYAIGVLAGNCWVQPDSDELSLLGLSPQGTNLSLATNQAVQVNLKAQAITAYASGRVVTDTGSPLNYLGFNANNWDTGESVYTQTDDSGYFTIGLSAGTWHLQMDNEYARQQGYVPPDFQLTLADGDNVSGLIYIARLAAAQVSGHVQTGTGSPIANVMVVAGAMLSGTNYTIGVNTDNNGDYQFGVLPGIWQVALEYHSITNLGYNCPPSQSITNTGANQTVDFVAFSGSTDTEAPWVQDRNPWSNANDVPRNAGLAITFSEPMQNGISITWNVANQFNYIWSGNQMTLFCVPTSLLPANATISYTLNPTPGDQNFKDLAGNPLPANFTGQFQTGASTPTPDVREFAVHKDVNYMQWNANTPVYTTNEPPFVAAASIDVNVPAAVTNVSVRYGAGSDSPLPFDQDSFRGETSFDSQALMDATYPNGTYTLTAYTVHDGIRSVALNLTGDNYPSVPHIANWTAAQSINPSNDFTLTWDQFANAGANTVITLEISMLGSWGDETVLETPYPGSAGALTAANTSFTIPAGKLSPGRNYRARLMFVNLNQVDSTSYPGAPGLAGYTTSTTFPLTTIGSPIKPTLQLLGFDNNGHPRLRINGIPDIPYTLEAANSLRTPTWSWRGSQSSSNAFLDLFDGWTSVSNSTLQYYRVREGW